MYDKATSFEDCCFVYIWKGGLIRCPKKLSIKSKQNSMLRSQYCPQVHWFSSAVKLVTVVQSQRPWLRRGLTHLHSALLCRNELHWSGRFVSFDMDSRIEMICLKDGRFWGREKNHSLGLKVSLEEKIHKHNNKLDAQQIKWHAVSRVRVRLSDHLGWRGPYSLFSINYF